MGLRDETRTTVVTGVEMFRKTLDEGLAGDNVGCLLRGHRARGRGARPGAGQAGVDHAAHDLPQRSVRAEEGRGRATHAVLHGYRPQFFIRTMDVTGEVMLDEGVEMVMPGDNANLTIKLITPVALEDRARTLPSARAAAPWAPAS